MIKTTPPISKVLIYTYTFLTGTSLLFSFAEAGKFDEVIVTSLNDATQCTQCMPCPIHENIGDCGENFVIKTLLNKKIPTYLAQYDASHGLDVVGFAAIGKEKIPFVILHGKKLALNIEYVLNMGGYFIRTGNLRIDANQRSYIQFYAITDNLSKKQEIETETFFTSGPFLQQWSNQYGSGFKSNFQELPLTKANFKYLYSLFS